MNAPKKGCRLLMQKGRIQGKVPAISEDQKIEVLRFKGKGRVIKDIATLFKVGVATVKWV